jgi:hypothetical protein
VNEVERMRIELDAALKRVRRLEVIFETRAIFTDDEREAQRIAEQLGFDVEILMLPVKPGTKGAAERRKVAMELRRRKNWPVSRIARALHCCERTAERMVV